MLTRTWQATSSWFTSMSSRRVRRDSGRVGQVQQGAGLMQKVAFLTGRHGRRDGGAAGRRWISRHRLEQERDARGRVARGGRHQRRVTRTGRGGRRRHHQHGRRRRRLAGRCGRVRRPLGGGGAGGDRHRVQHGVAGVGARARCSGRGPQAARFSTRRSPAARRMRPAASCCSSSAATGDPGLARGRCSSRCVATSSIWDRSAAARA